jgi:hypothetical protein
MDDSSGTLQTIARHLVLALKPLKDGVADLPSFRTLLYRLAWNVDSLPPEYTALAAKVDAALTALDVLGNDPPAAKVFDLLDKVKALYIALQSITNAPAGVDPPVFFAEIARSLFDLLLVDYLIEEFPSVHSALLALGIITEEFTAETSTRPGVLLSRVQWAEIPKVLTDPGSIPTRVYGWGTNDLDFHRIAGHLLEFFVALDWPAYIGRVDEETGKGFLDSLDDPTTSIEWGLKIPALTDNIGGKEIEVGLALLELPPQGGKPAGLILQPLVPSQIGTNFDLRENLKLELRAGTDVSSTLGVLLRPDDISVKFPFQEGTALPEAGFGVTLRYAPQSPALLLGAPGQSRLELKGMSTSFNLDFRDGRLELRLEAAPEDLKLVVAAADSDGFLGELLGGRDMTAPLPLTVRWSSKSGIGFAGGTGFQVSFPCNLHLGPIALQQVQLALNTTRTPAAAPDLILEAGASLGGQLGPVACSVDKVGLRLVSRFTDGNAGPFDIAIGFMPPDGVGLKVDSPAMTGGGFLFHDSAQGLYAGVMQLSLHDQLTLTAYGLIATKMPDGSRGYSLLIFITAEGFKPVPLGFGFLLQEIGGMVGVHRTFDQEVIKAGLQTDTLSTLLLPRDPVANAPALIQALATAFPAKRGSYLLGLVARITWFTPTLVQLDLALILELGARTRLLALGRVSALLPSRDNDLIRLNLDAMGVLDFDAGTLAVDAVLVDSRLAHEFPITGSAALRACWPGAPGAATTGASFVLAVGGLNPRFAPPTGFPALERVTIALCAGKNPRLLCDAYLAITANTVQFGSRASLYAEALGFSVAGDLGYDALVTLLPPHFIVDFHAAVHLKRGSHDLFKVTLDGTLEGPLPLRLAAKATFELLWISFSVHFDFTLTAGDLAQAALPAVALATELAKALADPGSWSTRRAPGLAHGVALRGLPPSAPPVLDPLGQLVVQQQVAPLNTSRDVDTYGGAPVAGPHRFHVAATLNGRPSTTVPGSFAPARYFAMSDDDKLVAPSFELMDAGLVLGEAAVTFDAATIVPAPLTYEAIVLNAPSAAGSGAPTTTAPAPPLRYTLPVAAFKMQRPSGAAARVPVRRVGRARFRNATVTPTAMLAAPHWRIVQASDGAAAPEDPSLITWSDYRAALATMNRGGARWLMVPLHELEA